MPPRYDEGPGTTAVDALRVQRALGGRVPSLAVAAAWHHFSMVTLLRMPASSDYKQRRVLGGEQPRKHRREGAGQRRQERARSAQSGFGGTARRFKTASSCRSIMSSTSLDA